VLVVLGALRPEHGLDGGGAARQRHQPAFLRSLRAGLGLRSESDLRTSVQRGPASGGHVLCGRTGQARRHLRSNNDCAPGSQCFTFTATGCSVMTCLRFCNNDDAMCGEQNAYCNVPIQCGTASPSRPVLGPATPRERAPLAVRRAVVLRLHRRNHRLRLPRPGRRGRGLLAEFWLQRRARLLGLPGWTELRRADWLRGGHQRRLPSDLRPGRDRLSDGHDLPRLRRLNPFGLRVLPVALFGLVLFSVGAVERLVRARGRAPQRFFHTFSKPTCRASTLRIWRSAMGRLPTSSVCSRGSSISS
jgi:hypothetical protein